MNWSQAFARQACSDFDARSQLLMNSGLPQCHQLHHLQMALEKTAKAHLIVAGGNPMLLQSSHAYIAKVIPIIVRDGLGKVPGAHSKWVIEAVSSLARKIELLHPQIDKAGTVPSNCEYPWEDGAGRLNVPAEYDFRLNLRTERAAITMLKEVRRRATELAQVPP